MKNAYRVLLSRGLKGCYVHFTDEATRTFVESRMAPRYGVSDDRSRRVAEEPLDEPREPEDENSSEEDA